MSTRFYGAGQENLLVLKRRHDAGYLNLLASSDRESALALETEPRQTRVHRTGGSCEQEVRTHNHSRSGFREHTRYRSAECDFLGDIVSEWPCRPRLCRCLRLRQR